jgi:salicylate hydroxylase
MNAMQIKFLCSGAGIGGLVLAVTIAKFADRDIQIDLYEAHDAIRTTGTGITVSRRTTEVLEALGLYEEISRVLMKPPSSGHGLSKNLSGNRV